MPDRNSFWLKDQNSWRKTKGDVPVIGICYLLPEDFVLVLYIVLIFMQGIFVVQVFLIFGIRQQKYPPGAFLR